jgi:hypothetical protein
VTNAFALLRLLPMSDWDKDTEILALRRQITVLERQLGNARPRFSPGAPAHHDDLRRIPHEEHRQRTRVARGHTHRRRVRLHGEPASSICLASLMVSALVRTALRRVG